MFRPIPFLTPLVALALVLYAPVPPQEPSAPAPDEEVAAIRSLLERWEEAFNSGNLELMKGYWTDDIVVLPQDAEPLVGLEAFWGSIEHLVAMSFGAFDVSYELVVDEIDVSGDMAFDRGTVKMTLTPKGGGDALVSESRRYLEILRKQPDGSWKISRAMTNKGAPR